MPRRVSSLRSAMDNDARTPLASTRSRNVAVRLLLAPIGHMDNALASNDPICCTPCDRMYRAVLSEPVDKSRITAHRRDMHLSAIESPYIAVRGLAEPRRVRQHGVEYRFKLTGRSGDDLKHLRRCCLLLQRLGKVSGALAKVVGALAQFVEQPPILDGDDGLR